MKYSHFQLLIEVRLHGPALQLDNLTVCLSLCYHKHLLELERILTVSSDLHSPRSLIDSTGAGYHVWSWSYLSVENSFSSPSIDWVQESHSKDQNVEIALSINPQLCIFFTVENVRLRHVDNIWVSENPDSRNKQWHDLGDNNNSEGSFYCHILK